MFLIVKFKFLGVKIDLQRPDATPKEKFSMFFQSRTQQTFLKKIYALHITCYCIKNKRKVLQYTYHKIGLNMSHILIYARIISNILLPFSALNCF